MFFVLLPGSFPCFGTRNSRRMTCSLELVNGTAVNAHLVEIRSDEG